MGRPESKKAGEGPMRRVAGSVASIILVALLASPAIFFPYLIPSSAENGGAYPPYVVRGTVTLEGGDPIEGARVYVENQRTDQNLSSLTDSSGRYTVAFNVSPEIGDEITVWCSHGGLAAKRTVVVSENPISSPILTVDLVLEKKPGFLWLDTVICGLPLWLILLAAMLLVAIMVYLEHRRAAVGEGLNELEEGEEE
ncbi:MAG: carboxypeptidase regulatory-like domain-containing protein, partial [Thermoplasmata archaeon]|nr:carboxypeptidase regulatory-like domain-containing protein [Thermoplasmata archaeon]